MATKINSAVAIGATTIRITFDSATNGDGSALVPAHYALTPSGTGPFYTPVVVAVADTATPPTGTPTIVDLTLDQECTPNVLYTITATSVTGVAVDSIHNIGLFYGLIPAAPVTREWSLIDFIPPVNIAEDSTGDLANFVSCLQEMLNLLWADIDNWGSIFDIDHCAPNFLDVILEHLGNPVEVPDLTVAENRKLCALLVDVYKIKGSIPGLQAAIKVFGNLPSQVYNFFGMGFIMGDGTLADGGYPGAGGGDPGTWVLGAGDPWAITIKCGTLTGVDLTAAQLERVTEIVTKTKPSVAHIVPVNGKLALGTFGAPARLDIKDNGFRAPVIITCAGVAGATSFQLFLRGQTGVNEWNGGTGLALTGTGPSAKTYTPTLALPAPTFWVACTATTIPGLLTNEITNALLPLQ